MRGHTREHAYTYKRDSTAQHIHAHTYNNYNNIIIIEKRSDLIVKRYIYLVNCYINISCIGGDRDCCAYGTYSSYNVSISIGVYFRETEKVKES